mmetsp:Transcript_10374/g.24023  ORF Transcript_10374/g.24023 Transcript_10374/m.24023 type:complete len:228 (+) Transcript_10374:1255-1938(+)
MGFDPACFFHQPRTSFPVNRGVHCKGASAIHTTVCSTCVAPISVSGGGRRGSTGPVTVVSGTDTGTFTARDGSCIASEIALEPRYATAVTVTISLAESTRCTGRAFPDKVQRWHDTVIPGDCARTRASRNRGKITAKKALQSKFAPSITVAVTLALSTGGVWCAFVTVRQGFAATATAAAAAASTSKMGHRGVSLDQSMPKVAASSQRCGGCVHGISNLDGGCRRVL